jgi:hypothetical protein
MKLSILGGWLTAVSLVRREPERSGLQQVAEELRSLDRAQPVPPTSSR